MRQRLIPVLGVLLIALTVPAAAAASQRPERFPSEGGTTDFPAGVVCDFTSRWETVVDHSTITVFPVRSNGDQVTRITGRYVTRVVNVDTGESKEYVTSARLDFVAHADGTTEVMARGPVLAAYDDTGINLQGMFYFVGNLHDTVDETFAPLAQTFRGTVEDVCATLS